MDRLLLVFLAGGVGSVVRYAFVTWTQRVLGEAFPWGILGVNVGGSFLIALVSVLAVTKAELTPTIRITLMAGFLGGFTTYSSFNQDTLSLLDRKLYGTVAAYVVTTLAMCLVGGVVGTKLGRRI